MKTPSAHFIAAFAAGLLLLFSIGANAQTPPPSRSKPQVIYQLPRASAHGATLHSQAKLEGNRFPVESSTPGAPSQLRSDPVEPFREPRAELEGRSVEPVQRRIAPQPKPTVKRAPSTSRRSVSASRGNGNGNAHGDGHRRKK